jgi:Condensation domain
MKIIATAPPTYGQLSVWRSIQDLPPSRMNTANLRRMWDLPAGCSSASVVRALGDLQRRHESLLTGYRRTGPRRLEQIVWEWDAEAVPVDVLDRDDGEAAADDVTQALAAEPFQLDREPPWRARVVTENGHPRSLALCIHHIAADGAAIDLLHSELMALLAGTASAPEPGLTCRALADEQHHDPLWVRRNAAALAYWERVLAEAPAAMPAATQPVQVCWAILHSKVARHAAVATAQETETSVHSVVLACFCSAIAARIGVERCLIGLLTGNRTDPRLRGLVTSMNQLVPLPVDIRPAESFHDQVRRLHLSTLVAIRHGCYDVDIVDELERRYGYSGVGGGFGYVFNFMPGELGESPQPEDPEDDANSEWSIETTTEGREVPFAVYFKGGVDGSRLACSLQEATSDGDDAGTRELLATFHEHLVAAAEQGGRP